MTAPDLPAIRERCERATASPEYSVAEQRQCEQDRAALIAEIERLRKALETITDAAESDIEPREYFAGIARAALAAVGH